MTEISYSAHISNKKSAITTKAKLAGVAKHNLRKYHSIDYSSENINLLYGTTNLMQDVKTIYEKEFSEALNNYNAKQIREDRKIDDYFEHVSESDQDMAVEIIIQCGDKEFWEENNNDKIFMRRVYPLLLKKLQEHLPDFKIANAVVHFDEASPHMHVVGVPVGRGFKRGLETKVSKRTVFTQETLSKVLQDQLRVDAEYYMRQIYGVGIREKRQGKNYDLSVIEYKVVKEGENLRKLSTDKKEMELEVNSLSWRKGRLEEDVKDIKDEIEQSNIFLKAIEQIKKFIVSYLPFAPLIEEFANTIEQRKDIQAGNSFRGIFNPLGELLNSFKEKIQDGVCWFPRLMRWKTSKGEVSPVFTDWQNEGYNYRLKSYANVNTKEEYSFDRIQPEIMSENRIGTLEHLVENIEAVERQTRGMREKLIRKDSR